MSQEERYIGKKFLQFILAALFLVLAMGFMCLLVYHDFKLYHYLVEGGWTELAQEGIIWLSALCFCYAAWRYQERGLYLVGGFVACMAIREMDSQLDKLFFHGAWAWLALPVAALFIYLALGRGRAAACRSLAAFLATRAYDILVVGLLWVLVVSRIYGMGVLWRLVVNRRLASIFKNFIEESMELPGYLLILAGAVYCLVELASRRERPR